MRRSFLGLVVVALAAGPAPADDKAEAVVKQAIKAHGGADALNKYTAGRFNMKGELSLLGMELEFTGKLSFALPDRYRLEMKSEIMGMPLVINQVVRGEKLRSSVMVGETKLPAGGEAEQEELKLASVLQEAEQLTPLLDGKKFTLKSAGEEDVNGKKATVVQVTSAAVKKDFKLYFDQASGMVVKSSHKGVGAGEAGAPEEVLEEVYHLDYKEVKGIKVPMKLEVQHDGKKFMTVRVSDYEALEKIDDKEFMVDD